MTDPIHLMPEPIRVRASGLAELFDCPRRWAAKHLDGMTLRTARPAHIGTALHASTAAFDAAVLAGVPVSAFDAAAVFVDALYRPDYDVDWEGERKEKAERIGLALHTRYCTEYSPTQTWLHVEMPLDPLVVDCGDGLALQLTGTLDRVRIVPHPDGARLGVADLKSGERAVNADGRAKTQGHGIQGGVYELLTEHTLRTELTAPFQVIGLQTTAQYRLGTGEIERPRDVVLGTRDQKGLLEYAADLLKKGDFYGNGRSMLCSPKYCPAWGDCPFKL